MKKIVLTALNARYIHSSLALAYLKHVAENTGWTVETLEFTINEEPGYILSRLYRSNPDVLGFSCYIWNIEYVLKLCSDLKAVRPELIIILGGPEVSYNAEEIMSRYPAVDIVVRGEGEITLAELLATGIKLQNLSAVNGVTYRLSNEILSNPDRSLLTDLDQVPPPYPEYELSRYLNRTIYYETSRGCPYNCSYCLSALNKEVRFFSVDRVKQELTGLIRPGVKEIRIIDRTFNVDEARAMAIMEFLLALPGDTFFHFEIEAQTLSSAMLDFLRTVPSNRFAFEIGVQSTCVPALQAVNRRADWNRLRSNLLTLRQGYNIKLHLDLIAGLPRENLTDFVISFNEVYSIQADKIQLGFLKILPGSILGEQADKAGWGYKKYPPYQILFNDWLAYEDMALLADMEELVERYYNSGFFTNTLHFMVRQVYNNNAFDFYREFSRFWSVKGWYGLQHNRWQEYSLLMDFARDICWAGDILLINELLKFDYLSHHNTYRLPERLIRFNPDNNSNLLYGWLRQPDWIIEHIPECLGKTPREVRRNIQLEYLKLDINTMEYTEEAKPVIFCYPAGKSRAMHIFGPV